MTIYGDGSQTRSFCYVDDLIDGLIKLMNSDFNLPINLGNPNEIKIKYLAELIKAKINPEINIINKPLPEDDPMQRRPVIDLASSKLNWEPKIDLDTGLERTISYFRRILNQ